MLYFPGIFCIYLNQLSGDIGFFNGSTIHLSATAGDKIMCAFQNYAHSFQIVKIQTAILSGISDPAGGFWPDSGNPKQRGIRCFFNFHWKVFEMAQRPVAFGIQQFIEVGLRFG